MAARTERPEISPELDAIRRRSFATRANVVELVGQVTDELFNERPEPDRWSMCECIDHLVVTGEKIVSQIDIAIEKGLRDGHHGQPPFKYSRIGNWIVHMSSAETYPPKRRLKTPALYAPQREQDLTSVVRAFSAVHDNFVEQVEACDGLHLSRIKMASPASKWIRLSLGQWLHLVVGHEERHVEQARTILPQLSKRS